MKYIIDIDGTICKEIVLANGRKDYVNHIPYMDRIERINRIKCTSCVNAKCDKHCRCMCHIEVYER